MQRDHLHLGVHCRLGAVSAAERALGAVSAAERVEDAALMVGRTGAVQWVLK